MPAEPANHHDPSRRKSRHRRVRWTEAAPPGEKYRYPAQHPQPARPVVRRAPGAPGTLRKAPGRGELGEVVAGQDHPRPHPNASPPTWAPNSGPPAGVEPAGGDGGLEPDLRRASGQAPRKSAPPELKHVMAATTNAAVRAPDTGRARPSATAPGRGREGWPPEDPPPAPGSRPAPRTPARTASERPARIAQRGDALHARPPCSAGSDRAAGPRPTAPPNSKVPAKASSASCRTESFSR